MRKAGDIYIDNQPFRVSSYQRGTTDDMVARFGSAEQGQTNLDLFKAKTQKGWRGGMFQKNWADDEMAGYISGFHHNPLDSKLYMTPEMEQTIAGGGMAPNGITAWCYFQNYLYIAYSLNPPSADTNALRKIDLYTNTITAVTLPAAIKVASSPITSMIVHQDKIFLTGNTYIGPGSFNLHRYDGNTTFNSISGAGTYRYLASFNDRLYGLGLGAFDILTNEFTSTASYTRLKKLGQTETGVNNVFGLLEYNGALYIPRTDGLYRYNGIDVTLVLSNRNNISTDNYNNPTVFNGRMYWSVRNKIFEFDGVNITQIVDMSDAYTIIDMAGGEDRLWISVRYNATSPSIYESDNFIDPIATSLYTYGLMSYNGIGFYEYKHETYSGDVGSKFGDYNSPVQYKAIPVDGHIAWFTPYLYLNASMETRSSGFYYHKQELAVEFDLDQIGDSRESIAIGSIYDGGYPAVPKTLNGIMAEYEGFGDNVLLVVEIRKNYLGVTSDWIEVFRSDNVAADGATNDYFLHDEVIGVGASDLATQPHLFNRIEYKITLTVSGALASVPKLINLTKRYTLQPRMRRTWVLGIPIFGADESDIDTQYMADGTEEARKAHELRKIIYDAYENKLPILFYDIDFSEVRDDSPLQIKGQNWLKDGDYIAIETTAGNPETWLNRRIQVSSYNDDYTEITLDDIGHRESIGAADASVLANVTAGDQVRKSYAAYVRRIQQERVIIDDSTVNTEAGYSDYSSELVIELIEA